VLAGYTDQGATETARWPKTPRLLSHAIRDILPQRRTVGMAVAFERVNNNRMITISLSESRGGAGSLAARRQSG